MKQIYFSFKYMKFINEIKSLKIRAIPDKLRKKAFGYSEWIFNIFYDEIVRDSQESLKPNEIRFTHFHSASWFSLFLDFANIFRVDGVVPENLQAMLSIV